MFCFDGCGVGVDGVGLCGPWVCVDGGGLI